jgi:hypothetical protein
LGNSLQHCQGLRIRVTDHHRRTLLARQADGGLQLGEDRGFGALVIEEHIPRNARQADLLRFGAATVCALVRLSTKNLWRCNSPISQAIASG